MDDQPDVRPTRRRFLVTSAATAISVSALVENCGPAPDNCPDAGTTVTAGEVALGAHVRPQGAAYVIARDTGGFYAYSNVCTHQGCVVPCPASTGVSTCPCHGAEFDANGNNIRPASGLTSQADLPHYLVSFQGSGATAVVVVDTGMILVDRAARVMPTNFA